MIGLTFTDCRRVPFKGRRMKRTPKPKPLPIDRTPHVDVVVPMAPCVGCGKFVAPSLDGLGPCCRKPKPTRAA